MLKALSFGETTEVINTGVDITLAVEPADREAALRAAKICGVCGISTAVLQIAPDEVGKRTIAAYCELTGRIVFADEALCQRVCRAMPVQAQTWIARGKDAQSFAKAIFSADKQR